MVTKKNSTEFLGDAGLAGAAETLADRRVFKLGDAQWQAFQKSLERPVRHKPRLAALLSKPSVVE